MRNRLGRPSPALVVALIALFVAMGGTGYAAATGSIDGREIKNSTIQGKDVKNSSLTGTDIKNGGLTGSDVKANSLTGGAVQESSFAKVPSAGNADTAGTAGTATNATNFGGSSPAAFERAKQWILVAADGTTKLAGSPDTSIEGGSTGQFTYVDLGRSSANRPLLVTSNQPSALATNGDVSATPCGGGAAPGGSTCSVGNDVNHVLVRKNTAQPFYLVVF
jgi:hypothetical protein